MPWLKHKNKWIAEISDLPHMEKPYLCLVCRRALPWKTMRNDENEVTDWQAVCTCGITFRVFND